MLSLVAEAITAKMIEWNSGELIGYRMPSFKQNNSSVNHKASISQSVSAFSFIFIAYLFIGLSSLTIKKFTNVLR